MEIIIGFTKKAYKRYDKALCALAVPHNSLEVINDILKDGHALYYGDHGEVFYFNKKDIKTIYR
jgi:hypothetical protein